MTTHPKHYCAKHEVETERCLEEILRGNDVARFPRAVQASAFSYIRMTERRLNPGRLATVDGERIGAARVAMAAGALLIAASVVSPPAGAMQDGGGGGAEPPSIIDRVVDTIRSFSWLDPIPSALRAVGIPADSAAARQLAIKRSGGFYAFERLSKRERWRRIERAEKDLARKNQELDQSWAHDNPNKVGVTYGEALNGSD